MPEQMKSNREVMEEVIKKFGKDHQLMKLFEEMSELQQAICHKIDGRDTTTHVAEEVADLMITLCEVMMIYDIESEVEEWLAYKIKRLRFMINGEEMKE